MHTKQCSAYWLWNLVFDGYFELLVTKEIRLQVMDVLVADYDPGGDKS